MKTVRLFIVVLVLAVMIPTVVYAAVGSFSSSTSTAAVTAKNTGSGRAVNATANTGYAGVFTRTAFSGTTAALQGTSYSETTGAAAIYGYNVGQAGQTYGVYGRTNSSDDKATGVYGLAAFGSPGFTNGVWGNSMSTNGTGVFGSATGPGAGTGVAGFGALFGVLGSGEVGVFGTSAGIADGTYGVLSDTDAGVGGHLMADGADVAGTCIVASGTQVSPTCTFPHAFPNVNVSIVATPTTNPGSFWWVNVVTASSKATGFTITLASNASSNVTFNYIVVGLDTNIAGASASKAAREARANR